jgi:hypothetical protein
MRESGLKGICEVSHRKTPITDSGRRKVWYHTNERLYGTFSLQFLSLFVNIQAWFCMVTTS